MTERPEQIIVTSEEEGMPTGSIFLVMGWTGFDQAVVKDEDEGVLLVLDPADFEPHPRPIRAPMVAYPTHLGNLGKNWDGSEKT